MLDQMKAMGAIAGLLRDKERLAELGDEFKARLERLSVTGSAGGGAVRVTMSGKMRVTEVSVEPAILESGEQGREMAQALILEATNEALEQAQAVAGHEAQRMARELDLPDIPGMERLLGS